MRKHLETEIRALRLENDKLKEDLATERAARVAMSGVFEDVRARAPSDAGEHRATSVDSANIQKRKDSNPFRNL